MIAEYALRDIEKPLAVTTYVTRLLESLPEELKEEFDAPEEAGPVPAKPKSKSK